MSGYNQGENNIIGQLAQFGFVGGPGPCKYLEFGPLIDLMSLMAVIVLAYTVLLQKREYGKANRKIQF